MAQQEPRVVEILRVFREHEVEFVVVGGVAGQLHGAGRATQDFDGVIERSRENLERVAAALRVLRAAYRQDDFTVVVVPLDGEVLDRLTFSRWSTSAGRVDLLPSIPAESESIRADFAALRDRATRALVDGQPVLVASLDDIIRSKEVLNRPKDREALEELRQLRDAARRLRRPPRAEPLRAAGPPATGIEARRQAPAQHPRNRGRGPDYGR